MIRKRPLVKAQIALKTLKIFRFEVWQINETILIYSNHVTLKYRLRVSQGDLKRRS